MCCAERHVQQYFSYIMFSLIGGINQMTRRKSQMSCKSKDRYCHIRLHIKRQNELTTKCKYQALKLGKINQNFYGLSWWWWPDSWIYNYLCNQCLSPLMLWVQTLFMARCTRYNICDKVCQWFAAAQWFSPGIPVSSTNKTDRHDMTEILLKVALNTINLNQTKMSKSIFFFTLQ